jgi:hypothetical protein
VYLIAIGFQISDAGTEWPFVSLRLLDDKVEIALGRVGIWTVGYLRVIGGWRPATHVGFELEFCR